MEGESINKTKLSQYVFSKRKESGLSARKFAKKFGVSDNIIGRYEKGEVDNPSNLEAYNFCKYFDLTVEEFLTKFDLGKKSEDELKETRNYLSVKLEDFRSTKTKLPDHLLPDLNKYFYLYTTDFCERPLNENAIPFYVPVDVILNSQNSVFKDISMAYFPSRVFDENALASYKDLCNAIAYALAVDQPLKTKEDVTANSFLFVVSSKAAFKELVSYFGVPKKGKNICVAYCEYRTQPLYFVVSGEDFIDEINYKYGFNS